MGLSEGALPLQSPCFVGAKGPAGTIGAVDVQSYSFIPLAKGRLWLWESTLPSMLKKQLYVCIYASIYRSKESS